jgi:hypothetical protein
MVIEQHPIKEAERYMRNAREVLSKNAGKSGDYYTDGKYVKAAGNYAWNGVLVALDATLKIRQNLKKTQRPDFKDYQQALNKKAPKMNPTLLTAYDLLHKSLGYDGVLSYKVVQDALNEGKKVIDWADKNYVEKN